MNTPCDMLEQNVQRLIGSAAETRVPEPCSAALLDAVLEELQTQRRRRARKKAYRIAALSGLAAAAATVIVTVLLWPTSTTPVGPSSPAGVGQVQSIYGLVTLSDGSPGRLLSGSDQLLAGQWVQTLTGSQARLMLPDSSEVLLQPRTLVQVQAKPDGQKVVLQEGQVRIHAQRQAPGRSLTVITPGSEITVLGTTLDVHVIQKPDGRRQTRVSVSAGKIQMSSAGKIATLQANMEGITDEGLPPVTRALVSQINELARLAAQNADFAARTGRPVGPPAIMEFNGDGSATVWTLLELRGPGASRPPRATVVPAFGCADVEAYLPQGMPLPARAGQSPGQWEIDLSSAPPPGEDGCSIVLRLSQVAGIFQTRGSGEFEVTLPGGDGRWSLLEFHLPSFAVIQEASPSPLERRQTPSRIILLLQAETPKLFVEPRPQLN